MITSPSSSGIHDLDDVQLAERIAALLGDRRIATAESCTAGRVAERLACVPGAAQFLRGGLVSYQEEVKRTLLGVEAESVFTPSAAEEMAAGAQRLLDAQISVATTGVAGGDDQDGVPAGTVFIATNIDGRTRARRHEWSGEPEEVCDRATTQALRDLLTDLGS